jgi:AcrR family transcriptional regulator
MPRYQRTDWLEHGLGVLAQHGVEMLTIETLCQALKVTKGSFYHHFAHREAFLEALLAYWEDHYTSAFITQSMEAATPTDRLQRLLHLVVQSHGTSENFIRAWAQTAPVAQAVQQRVDQRRIAFVRECLLGIRADAAWAHTTAHLLYTVMVGAAAVIPPLTRAELSAIYALLESLMMSTQDEKD